MDFDGQDVFTGSQQVYRQLKWTFELGVTHAAVGTCVGIDWTVGHAQTQEFRSVQIKDAAVIDQRR